MYEEMERCYIRNILRFEIVKIFFIKWVNRFRENFVKFLIRFFCRNWKNNYKIYIKYKGF